jgi:uroporphyrinogen-III decarboxylase
MVYCYSRKDFRLHTEHYRGVILAPGCEVPTIAPPEKIDWFMELANEVGAYN